MGINRRLHRLESAFDPNECPDFGWRPPVWGEDEIEIIWYDGWEVEDGELVEAPIPTDEPTRCPKCLQPDFIVIRWLDLEDEEEDWHPDED
jgi:hypothetical protein